MLRALIFDVDGTLAETEDLHRQAFNRAFAELGLSWRWAPALYADLLTVMGGKERLAHYIDTQHPAEAEALHALELLPVAALPPARVGQVLLAARGIDPRGLEVPPGIGADPHITPGGWDGQGPDAVDVLRVLQGAPGGIEV